MDPLSITASITGILALAGAIISKGYACASRIKKNESEWLTECPATMWQDSMRDCEKTLKELGDILDSLSTANVIQLMVKGESKATKIEKLLSKLERFKGFFVLCLQLQNNDDSTETSRLTRELSGLLNRLLSGQEFLKKEADLKEEYRKREMMMNWLGPTSEDMQDDLVRSRDTNSGEWLLNRAEFVSWLSSDESARFWLWGAQGSGKNCHCETVASKREMSCYTTTADSQIAQARLQRLVGALVAMHLRKLDSRIPIPESLSTLSKRYRSSSYPSLEELQRPFHELCQHYSRIFVIIDGLDEIADRSGILKFLTDLQVAVGTYKVFVASRPEVVLESAFDSYITVAITQADVQLDMETYVLQQLEKLQIDHDDEPNPHRVVSELVDRAQGMFLWAVCQIDHLSRIRTAITPDVLTALPRGLESTFEGVLSRLEGVDQILALDILRVIMFSYRPLDLSEVVEAIAMTPRVRNLKQLRMTTLRRPTDVFQLCGSLIRQSRTTGKLSLAHYSVQEFLSRPKLERGRQNLFFLQEKKSQQKQFETCMSYLSLTEISSATFRQNFRLAKDSESVNSEIQIFAGYPFLDYAVNYWPSHFGDLGFEGMELVWPLLETFLLIQPGGFESWALVSQYIHGHYKVPEGIRPIHIAALYGMEALTLELLKLVPLCLNVQTADGRTPLHIALENEHERILDLLVQRGASLTIKDGKGRTPLHTAIESGSALAVTQLVNAGADVNVVQPDGETAISVAVENRWDQLATFLSQMADPKTFLPDGRSLLHLAAQSGSLVWTTTLLEYHGEQLIDTEDDNGWTPLHYAIDQGHPAIAMKLISAKCVVNHLDKNGWTPLHAAIRRHNLESVSLILEAEWPGGRPGKEQNRTLSSSLDSLLAETDEVSTPRKRRRGELPLLPRSRRPASDIGTSGKYGRHFNLLSSSNESSSLPSTSSSRPQQPDPLYLAVLESYLDGVKLLVKYTNKLGLRESQIFNCLQSAVHSKNAEIAFILMELVSNSQLGPLLPELLTFPLEAITEQAKARFTSDEIYGVVIRSFSMWEEGKFATLIKVWPDPGGPLIVGVLKSHVNQKDRITMARLLIKNGISPSDVFMEQEEQSLLHCAIATNDAGFGGVLVENGADVDVQNKQGETPLLVLASQISPVHNQNPVHHQNRQQALLRLAGLLVSKGADTQALDQRGRGLCHRAAAAGNEKFMDWILDTLHLQLDLRDNNSRTPLLLAVESGSVAIVHRLLQWISSGNDYIGPERVVDAMEYANMRSSPLLRAMVQRAERKINIVTALVDTDERAFAVLSRMRQEDLLNLRTAFYIEALCWTIDCDFATGFTFLFPKIAKSAISSVRNLDGDTIFHSAAGANGSECLKTLLQTLGADDDKTDILRIANAQGKTPLDLAIESSRWENVPILVRSGAELTGPQLQKLKEKGSKEVYESLLQHHMTSGPGDLGEDEEMYT